jgi:hypothetical protein
VRRLVAERETLCHDHHMTHGVCGCPSAPEEPEALVLQRGKRGKACRMEIPPVVTPCHVRATRSPRVPSWETCVTIDTPVSPPCPARAPGTVRC